MTQPMETSSGLITDLYHEGETLTQSIEFTPENVKYFANLTGDTNAMHHDDAFAAQSRFGGLIVSGTHYSALMMGMAASFLTDRGAGLGLEFNFQFRKAVMANDTVEVFWRVTEVKPNEKLGGDLVSMDGVLRNSDGEVCVTSQSLGLVLPPESI